MEKIVLGTCHHDCPDSCGWVATVTDDPLEGARVTKLRGNPDHPFSQGELCPKVNRFVERVYNADRLLHPLIRTGAKGTATFRQATWDEALELVAERVTQAVAEHGGETVMPWVSAGTQGLIQMSSLDQRFFAKIGATRQTGSICGATAAWGMAATHGNAIGAEPKSIQHSDLAVLWGTNTRMTNRHLWPFVERARNNGAKVVVIDPIKTMTAESADWFIQPKPGTDVAFMLATMHVLIRDDMIDHDYVNDHTTGYDELVPHVADWTPQRAADICGVPAAEIEQFAQEYGQAEAPYIRTLIGAEHHENGAMFFRTAACLPLLTGSWRHVGGGISRSVGAWAEPFVNHGVFDAPHLADGKSRRGLSMNHLGRSLTDPDMEPPITALFVWNGNPLATIPQAELIRQGMSREDLFCVVSEQFMTDTARYADVIFPATTQLEHTDVVESWGSLNVGWNQAAIAPRGEAVPNTELFRRLSKAMGFTEAELFDSDESLIQSAIEDRLDMDQMRSQGFVRIAPEGVMPYADGGFGYPDGKAQFACPSLEAQGLPRLPDYIAPTEGATANNPQYPLALLTPKTQNRFLNSSYSGLAGHGDREGQPWLELTETDAQERKIADGDQVRVFNDRGSLILQAKVSDRTGNGVVAVPFGWWGEHFEGGGTANSLTSDAPTDWGGGAAYSDTSVQVERFPAAAR